MWSRARLSLESKSHVLGMAEPEKMVARVVVL